jgi:hypothetical protein
MLILSGPLILTTAIAPPRPVAGAQIVSRVLIISLKIADANLIKILYLIPDKKGSRMFLTFIT